MEGDRGRLPWFQDTYGFYPSGHWNCWVGWTFPTPVSDGEFVYADMGQGQVVCYDLNGNRRWARFFRRNPQDVPSCVTQGTAMGVATALRHY